MLYTELHWLNASTSTDLLSAKCAPPFICEYLPCTSMKGASLSCRLCASTLSTLISFDTIEISANDVLSNPFTVFFFLRTESHSAAMNRTAITIPTPMVIKTHSFKWNTGVLLDRASLIELFGDHIFFSLSGEQPYDMLS
uniref:Uncharacterized protein n=1 Tax=Arundo donax TaxID=35708 RepID=A0A0A9EMA9_ARUDO